MSQKRTTATREPVAEKKLPVRSLFILCPACRMWIHQSVSHTCTRGGNIIIKF